MRSLFLKAFTDTHSVRPAICLIRIDSEFKLRLQTLLSMLSEFDLQQLQDLYPVAWYGGNWTNGNHVATHSIVVERGHCWWTSEVLTDCGTATVFTERVTPQRLLDAIESSVADEIHYTEIGSAAQKTSAVDSLD